MLRSTGLIALCSLCSLLTACGSPPIDEAPTVDAGPDDDDGFDNEVAPGVFAFEAIDSSTDTQTLAAFSPIVGDARFVGLGESVHTVGTYYAAKSRLFQYLVEEEGFRVFAFETPWLDAEQMRSFIDAGCPGTDRDLTLTLATTAFGVWFSEETLEGLRFMCTWNQEHPDDRVGFYGFDAQQPFAEGPALVAALNAVAAADAARADTVAALVAGVERCLGATQTEAEYFAAFPFQLNAEDHAACINGLDQVDALLDDVNAPVEPVLTAAALRASETLIWHAETFNAVGGEPDLTRSFEARDVFMARATVELADLYFPGERVVVWAHNTHLAKEHDQSRGGYYAGIQTQGTFLGRALGADYVAIALLGENVSINWPGLDVGPRPAPGQGDVETLLGAQGHPVLLLDLQRQELFDDTAVQTLQAEPLRPALHFDALLFFRDAAGMTIPSL